MGANPLQVVVDYARQVAGTADDGQGPSDADLLKRFLARRDHEAFGLLVRRQGPMVFGVCRRVLGDEHLAWDAFQAVFLVLARDGHTVRTAESLGPWLSRVAFRLAVRARARREVRSARLRPFAGEPEAPESDPAKQAERDELLARVDAEVDRLPEKYRIPVVLCLLEGRSREDVAHTVGCTAGAVRTRLSRGLERLRSRLERRELAVGGRRLACLLAPAAAAALPREVVAATVAAAMRGPTRGAGAGLAALSRTAAASKLRWAAVALVAATLGSSVGGAFPRSLGNHSHMSAARPVDESGTPAVLDPQTVLRTVVVPRVLEAFDAMLGQSRCAAAEVEGGAARVVLTWEMFPFDTEPSLVEFHYPLAGGRLELFFSYQGRAALKPIHLDKPIILHRYASGQEVVLHIAQLKVVEDAFEALRR